jgi:hypothetical protein
MKKSILLMVAMAIGQFIIAQECTELFFSEYVEGSGNNKAIEIYNPTDNVVDLSIYTIKRYSNGSPVPSDEVTLSGTIQSKGVVVVTNGQTDSVWVSSGGYWSLPINDTLYDLGDLHCSGIYPTAMYFNGNDAITLEKITGDVVDIFGKIGTDPGSNGWNDIPPTYFAGDEYWTSWTKDQTLIRKPTVKDGVKSNPEIFMVNVEWDSIPKDSWDSLGFHTCDCKTSGITQYKFKHSIVMYPNPSTNKIVTISASEKIEFISLVNQFGQVVYSKEFVSGKKEVVVKGEFLTKGIYIVTTRFVDSSVYSGKLNVQ